MARSKRGALPSCRSASSSAIPVQTVLSRSSFAAMLDKLANFVADQKQPGGRKFPRDRGARNRSGRLERDAAAREHIIMIAAARRQNYAAAAHVPGRRRPLCMVDFCVYLFYRAALALITALPLRIVFSLGNGLGFLAWLLLPNLSATRPPERGNCVRSEKNPPRKKNGSCAVIFNNSAPISSAG